MIATVTVTVYAFPDMWRVVRVAAGQALAGVDVTSVSASNRAPEGREAGFELRFLDPDGRGGRPGPERCCSLRVGWSTRFERVAPVRRFGSFRGQRHFPGAWWTPKPVGSAGRLVGFESWLERDVMMALDFDRSVVAFASQPFWLSWMQRDGRRGRHAPDLFARLRDGIGVVIDVRADDRIEPEDARAFAATAQACAQVGWEYRRVGELEPVLAANLRWLAGYRHPRCRDRAHEARLVEVLSTPSALMDAAERVGDPIAVLPTLFHLIWTGVLGIDLRSAPLTGTTPVTVAVPEMGL